MKKIIFTAALFSSLGLFAKTETIKHKVQPKETLFRISLMYNSTVHDIEVANPGINAKHVSYGSVIRVPKNTKMRDPQFVASILSGQETVPVSQIAIATRTEEKSISKPPVAERSKQISMPVRAEAVAPKVTEPIAPKIEEIKEVHAAAIPAQEEIKAIPAVEAISEVKSAEVAAPIQNNTAEENPFLTPSEPRVTPAVDEQPVKPEQITEPASAQKTLEEDENPFMSPKAKSEEAKVKTSPTSSNE